jgi:hypothetical protein
MYNSLLHKFINLFRTRFNWRSYSTSFVLGFSDGKRVFSKSINYSAPEMDLHQVKASLLVKLPTYTKINRNKIPQGTFHGKKQFHFCVLVIKERIKYGLNRKCISRFLCLFCWLEWDEGDKLYSNCETFQKQTTLKAKAEMRENLAFEKHFKLHEH